MPWQCERCANSFEPVFVSEQSVSGHVVTTFATLCDDCRWIWTAGVRSASLPAAKTVTATPPWWWSVMVALVLYGTLCLMTRGCW